MGKIELVPDADLLLVGITKYLCWEYTSCAHVVVYGSTGSGKTYLCKIILGRISKGIADSELIICDYKADADFSFLEECENFFRFTECMKGLEKVYEELCARQSRDSKKRHFLCLFFDEWASFVSNLEKKEAERAKTMLASLLMLGRSFQIHVIISQQRVDSVYFGNARDNFSVIIGMGRLSKESVQMMFSDYKDEIIPNKPRGYGTAIIGNRLRNIVVPRVRDTEKLHRSIREAVERFLAVASASAEP